MISEYFLSNANFQEKSSIFILIINDPTFLHIGLF